MNFKNISLHSYQNLWDDPYKIEEQKNKNDEAFDSFRDDELFDERDYQDSRYSIYDKYSFKPLPLDVPKEYSIYDTDDLPVAGYDNQSFITDQGISIRLSSQERNKHFDTDLPLENIGGVTSNVMDVDKIAKKGLSGYESTNLKAYVYANPQVYRPKQPHVKGDVRFINLSEKERLIDGSAVDMFKEDFTQMYPSANEYLHFNKMTIANTSLDEQSIYGDNVFFQYFSKFDKLCKSKEQVFTIMDDCMVTVDKANGTNIKGFNRHLCKFAEDILNKTGNYGENESMLMGLLHTPDDKLDTKALFETRQGFEKGESVSELLSKLQH